jgi:hypothetical protein
LTRAASGVSGSTPCVEVEDLAAGQHVLPQRHRAVLGDDDPGLAAHGLEPLAELLGVGDRRREGDQLHRLGQVDDHLLPDRAAEAVGEVVHLVHHHEAEAVEGGGAGVEHVAQHLGGHHHHRRVAVDRVVPGQQADVLGPVPLDQVGELLVRQGLDGGGVEALAALAQRQEDRVLPHDGLAGPGRRRHEDPVPPVQRCAALDLEFVEPERIQSGELRERRGHGPHPRARVRHREIDFPPLRAGAESVDVITVIIDAGRTGETRGPWKG